MVTESSIYCTVGAAAVLCCWSLYHTWTTAAATTVTTATCFYHLLPHPHPISPPPISYYCSRRTIVCLPPPSRRLGQASPTSPRSDWSLSLLILGPDWLAGGVACDRQVLGRPWWGHLRIYIVCVFFNLPSNGGALTGIHFAVRQ